MPPTIVAAIAKASFSRFWRVLADMMSRMIYDFGSFHPPTKASDATLQL
jgi:hypothetical protein